MRAAAGARFSLLASLAEVSSGAGAFDLGNPRQGRWGGPRGGRDAPIRGLLFAG